VNPSGARCCNGCGAGFERFVRDDIDWALEAKGTPA
jgi:hypothetical protein